MFSSSKASLHACSSLIRGYFTNVIVQVSGIQILFIVTVIADSANIERAPSDRGATADSTEVRSAAADRAGVRRAATDRAGVRRAVTDRAGV